MSEVDTIIVNINTPGGEVNEGYAIYDRLRALGKKIITRGFGQVASIGTIIMLAGDEREISKSVDFLIHFPWGSATGNADDFERQADELRKVEDRILNTYVERTGADREILREIMAKESSMTADKALELKFATKIMDKVVAFARITKHKTSDDEDKILNTMKKFFGDAFAQLARLGHQSQVKNMDVKTTDGKTLSVEGEEIASGSAVTIDGQPAADGTYELEDGRKVTVSGGKVSGIENKPADKDKEIADLKAENDRLQKELDAKNAEVTNLKTDVDTMKAEVGEITTALKNMKTDVKFNTGKGGHFNQGGGDPVKTKDEERNENVQKEKEALKNIRNGKKPGEKK